MKRRVLLLLLVMATAVSLLSGCGGTAKEAESAEVAKEALAEEVAKEAPVEESVEEPEPECAHEWAEATFSAPKTCSICGETEGERKLSYFEEHGVEVPDGPLAGTVDSVIYDPNSPEQHQKVVDVTWDQLSCRREPAKEEGYEYIVLELHTAVQLFYDGAQDVNYIDSLKRYCIYDWYTGQMFPIQGTDGDGEQEYSTVVEVDGKSYDISYFNGNQSQQEDWIEDGAGNASSKMNGYWGFGFKVPKGYDGLVFCIWPVNEYKEINTETVQGADEAPIYVFDEDVKEGTLFFRLNREGSTSIEDVQPSETGEQSAAE